MRLSRNASSSASTDQLKITTAHMKRFVSLRSIFVSAWLLSSIMGVMSPGPSAESMLHEPIQAGIIDTVSDAVKAKWIEAQIAYKTTQLELKKGLYLKAQADRAAYFKDHWLDIINPFSDPDEQWHALKAKIDELDTEKDELEKEIDELKAELKALEKE